MTPGTLIASRYRIANLLGRGGMGAVYEAVDLQTDRRRAIKLMFDHKIEDPDARARFELEARVAGRINSPFVVDVIDAGVDAGTGTPYIVMELLDGENLDQRLARLGPRPPAEAVEVLGQVARAMRRMHASNVVHRDLKPSNLFVESCEGGQRRIKVLDLGVAKVLSATGSDTTAVVGSLPYMAPEQIRGHAVGPQTDLYALGLIAFTLLTGSPYWTQGRDEPPIALAMKIADGPRDAASARARVAGVELPLAFDAWFARITAQQPARRFQSATEAVRALAAALGVEPPAWEHEAPEAPALATGDTLDQSRPRPAPVADTETASGLAVGTASTEIDRRRPPGRRARWRRGAMVLVVLGGAAGARLMWPFHQLSPLAAPGSVVACPILAVEGNLAEWGWLGAAAGSLACERARVILGGLASRTRAPAELLDLRHAMAHDDDPYGSDDARARSLAAARSAEAYLDGSVFRVGVDDLAPTFRVELVLRRADASEVMRASGEASALYEAVRAAMNRLVAAHALPAAGRPDPTTADYARAHDIATMLHLLDLKLAMVNHAGGGLTTECAWFAAADVATDLAPLVRYLCNYTFGERLQPVGSPSATTPGARVARARIAHMVDRRDDPAAIEELTQLYGAESSRWARSVIAGTLSCLLQATAHDKALTWALRAVADEPKNPTGEWCGPWGQLMSVADDTSSAGQATVGWRVWAPWESYAWLYAARNTKRDDLALSYAERAYVLSPLDTNVAGELSQRLLVRGQGTRVGAIANRLGDSPHPVHQVLSRLLTVRFDASEGRFSDALETARHAMMLDPGDAGWVRAQRLEIAWHAVEVANVLGRASELAELAITEFVEPDPPILDWAPLETSGYITAICAYASPQVAQRCFARLTELKPPLSAPFIDGARRFAAGDLRAAAEAWRPLVRDADTHVDLLAEAMVRAFSAAGDHELATRIEARTRSTAALFDGASMAMARAAQAAKAGGDRTEAAHLAKLVLDAWTRADTRPPILDEILPLVH
jgi:tRNA A-37 threonylcarbamoyl transferase component Bud32